MAISFVDVFKTSNAQRDNFLARVFAMFSEEPVRIWGESEEAQYEYIGRPTLKLPGESRGQTIDFAFRSKQDGRVFVAELKCELAFQNYCYLVLSSSNQVQRHVKERKEAFVRFVAMARNPKAYAVSVSDRSGRSRPVEASGAILVWGSVTDEGRRAVIEDFGFADVRSVEAIICDLLRPKTEPTPNSCKSGNSGALNFSLNAWWNSDVTRFLMSSPEGSGFGSSWLRRFLRGRVGQALPHRLAAVLHRLDAGIERQPLAALCSAAPREG